MWTWFVCHHPDTHCRRCSAWWCRYECDRWWCHSALDFPENSTYIWPSGWVYGSCLLLYMHRYTALTCRQNLSAFSCRQLSRRGSSQRRQCAQRCDICWWSSSQPADQLGGGTGSWSWGGSGSWGHKMTHLTPSCGRIHWGTIINSHYTTLDIEGSGCVWLSPWLVL